MSAMNEAVAPASPSRLSLWRDRVDFQGIVLGVICTIVTLLLLIGARMTADTIALRVAEDRLANLNQVLPASLYDNSPISDVLEVTDTRFSATPIQVYPARLHGEFTAAAFQVTTSGYGGPMTLMLALDAEGTILGVRVLSHRETPGLADKIEIGRSRWIESFNGLSLGNTATPRWAVKKDGGQFDQFTGATITPRAVVKGVYEGLQFFERQRNNIRGAPSAQIAGE